MSDFMKFYIEKIIYRTPENDDSIQYLKQLRKEKLQELKKKKLKKKKL